MAAQSKGVTTPVVFNFNSLSIRAITDEQGNPWFVASDVCNILGYRNLRQTVADHCRQDGVSKRYVIDRMGRKQETHFINEGNLYRLIIKSKKPEAEKFERLVMEEILPAIRKTGSYSGSQKQVTEKATKRYSYNYPRHLLEQPYFKTAHRTASLSISMLSNTEKFISPLFGLLNQLQAEGHDVEGAWDEAMAMREAIIKADETLKEIYITALRADNYPSEFALKDKR